MRKLSLSKKYVPGYVQVEQLKKEAQKIGEERGRKAEKIEMAKTMREEGESPEKISKYTGLSREEVEKL
jgi:hypothetical protein